MDQTLYCYKDHLLSLCIPYEPISVGTKTMIDKLAKIMYQVHKLYEVLIVRITQDPHLRLNLGL